MAIKRQITVAELIEQLKLYPPAAVVTGWADEEERRLVLSSDPSTTGLTITSVDGAHLANIELPYPP